MENMEHNHESEPKLTFPSADRELDVFFGPELARDCDGDGGPYIRDYDRHIVRGLYERARRNKARLHGRLGLDDDGRRWLTLARPNLRDIREDESRYKDGSRRQQAFLDLHAIVDQISEAWEAASRLWLAGVAGPHTKYHAALLRDFGEHPRAHWAAAPSPLGQRLWDLYELMRYAPIEDVTEAQIGLLSMLPADDTGKRNLRTAKVLSKHYSGPLSVNTTLAKLLDLLAQQKSHICISVNPIDFILSATRGACDFSSCHSLDGCHSAGNSAYVRDQHTALVFVTKSDKTAFPFFKTGRAWLYIGPNDQICMGRLYGRGLSPKYVNYIVRQVELILRFPGERWRVANNVSVDLGRLHNIGTPENHHWPYAGYHDNHYARVAVPKSYLLSLVSQSTGEGDEEDEDALPRVSTGLPELEFEAGICLACGTDVGYEEAEHKHGMCTDCADRWICNACDCTVRGDRRHTVHGDVCDDCRENYTTCSRCDVAYPDDETRTVRTIRSRWGDLTSVETQWCNSCHHAYLGTLHHCESCETDVAHLSNDPVTLDDGTQLCAAHAITEVRRCNDCSLTMWAAYDECANCADHESQSPATTEAANA